MSLRLPEPIKTYIASENADAADVLASCFAEDAVVRDEGRTIQGLAAIKAWKIASKAKYQHKVAPIRASERDGKTIVTAKVSGNFPGSPVDLEFTFGLKDDKIISLEIH
jgi:SnoaL-like domain